MTLTDLKTRIRFLLGDVSTDQYSDANVLNSLNDHYQQAVAKIVSTSKSWICNGEIATTNIVSGQKEYTLPADCLAIDRIEVNYTGGTNTWIEVGVKDMRNIAGALTNNPSVDYSNFVHVYDEYMWLEFEPSTSVTNGIKVYYSKEITALSGASDTPNLIEAALKYLQYGACLDYALSRGLTADINNFSALQDKAEKEMINYYTNRLPVKRSRITARKESYN